MRVKLLRCRICLAWYSPIAHCAHCPYCGAQPIGHRHYAMNVAGNMLRELFSVVGMPLVLRNLYTR